MSGFDPNSSDAMFAKILERLDQQKASSAQQHLENTEVLQEIREQTTRTNGRVTKLEQTAATIDRVKKLEDERKYFTGWVAGVSGIAGIGWVLFAHFFPR